MKLGLRVGKIIHDLENLFLLVIALLTVIGAVKEIYFIADKRDVALQDLLLMFLYVEVLAMVGAYYDSKQIPITLPIFIAITALARLTILQKDQEPLNLVYEAAAILVLAIAAVVVAYRPPRATRTPAPDDNKVSTRSQRSGASD
jgi:protein PsiE